ncbi:MAG: 3-isopropylmalate dehydratase large subunit [Thermoplasmatota archaeon]
MTMSMIEQIISAHSDSDPRPGDIVWMGIDLRTARDFGGANVVKNMEKHYPGEGVDDPEKTFFTFDTVVPAKTIPYAENQHLIRRYARKLGLRVYDVDQGIGSHVVIEEGLAHPGVTMAGTDSHLNILGAVGAFGQGMGDKDIAFIFKTGRTWFEVPETMRVNIEGEMPSKLTPRDLTLKIVGEIGSSGGLGRSMEFSGGEIDNLSLSGRITLASMGTEMGAICCQIEPSAELTGHFKEITGKDDMMVPRLDDAYPFVRDVEIDVSDMEPMISMPGKPDNVVPVSSVGDVEVDSVFIGSCTNGTYEDIRRISEITHGRKVAPGVMAKIVPATRRVWGRLLEEGIMNGLHESGFIISNSGCGGCASGQIGMTGTGEVQVSTSNRNFIGKQGKGNTYLASPDTAAASAVIGRIATVFDLE